MNKKKEFVTSVADLLPEGLDENLMISIAKLLSDKINEEVANEVQSLTRKTVAFIRNQIDKLKEQALKELELENDTYRNAKMFETVRSFFAVELTGDDEMSAINALASIGESQDNQIGVLVNEVESLAKENSKLKKSLKIVMDKNKLLESSVTTLSEQMEVTESNGSDQAPIMSDSAVVVSENNFKKKEQPKVNENSSKLKNSNNVWLTEDVLQSLNALR